MRTVAQEFIHKRLKYNFSYNEFMAVRLAFEYALREDLEAISRLEEIMEAGKIPRETREASRKLGSRFIKTLSALELPVQNSIFDKYREARKGKSVHHAVAVWCLLWSGRNRRKRSTGTFYLCTDLCDGHKLRKNDSIKSVFRSEALKRMLSTSAGTDKKSDRTRRRMARTFRTGI